MIYLILLLVCSYFLGNVNPALIIARLKKGIDIRDFNSKNAGATNTVMTVGFRWGIVVMVFDIIKGTIPVLVARSLFEEQPFIWVLAGFFAILGHVFPFFYKFKGGKGTATYAGLLFGISPLFGLFVFISFFIILLITDYIVISTIFSVIFVPIYIYFFTDLGLYPVLILILIACMSILKHLENIKRLLEGKELSLRSYLIKRKEKAQK